MPHPDPSFLVAAVVLAALTGVGLESCHRRGTHLRAGEVPRRRLPAGALLVPTVATAAWFALVLPHDTVTERLVLGLHLLVGVATVALAGIDVAVHRLPDTLTVPLTGTVLVAFGLTATGLLGPGGEAGRRALLAGVVASLSLLVAALVLGGIGLGDVKLACPLGAVLGWHGWDVLLTGAALAWLLAALVALCALVRGAAHRGTAIPLGPFLGLGALLAVVL
ncbi:A24 family peptidase [Mobilicoccus sp.]|uniref:A24 family peptidase n=1 Tax=Mobilicoccus sp. TaxID=2034349 RepID=UPI0028A181F0|nr:A24 family peptidase [Mobilicoccus sp.]